VSQCVGVSQGARPRYFVCAASYCSMLQCVAVCVAVCCGVCCSAALNSSSTVLQHSCSGLQCVAMCCSALQCIAVYCRDVVSLHNVCHSHTHDSTNFLRKTLAQRHFSVSSRFRYIHVCVCVCARVCIYVYACTNFHNMTHAPCTCIPMHLFF